MQGVVLILFTPDFERVLAFYERLLEMPAARRSEGYAEFSWGSVTWGIHRAEAAHPAPGPVHVHFVTDQLDAALERARTGGAQAVGAPVEEPWGREATVTDPAGWRFEILEPVSARRGP
jgi:lactoylglutathione lyase